MTILRTLALFTGLALALSSGHAAESRIPIAGPVTITGSGTYVLTRDISTAGIGIDVGGGSVTIDLNGHTITAPNLSYGVQVRGGAVVVLTNGHLRGGLASVYVYGSTSRVRMSNLDIANSYQYAIHSNDAAEVVITDSTIQSNSEGIRFDCVSGKTHVRVTGNTIDATVRAIDFGGSASVNGGEIGTNILQSTTDAAFVILGNFGGLSIHDNSVTTGNGSGLYLAGLGGNLVQNNTVQNAAGNGIEVQSRGNRIVGNVVSNCGNNGITIPVTEYNIVEFNTCSRNGGYGIYLGGGANGWRNNLSKQNALGDYFNNGGNMDGGGNL